MSRSGTPQPGSQSRLIKRKFFDKKAGEPYWRQITGLKIRQNPVNRDPNLSEAGGFKQASGEGGESPVRAQLSGCEISCPRHNQGILTVYSTRRRSLTPKPLGDFDTNQSEFILSKQLERFEGMACLFRYYMISV